MFTLNVNGNTYTANHDKNLLAFLRDDLRLTAAKDGCSEGACGACTVARWCPAFGEGPTDPAEAAKLVRTEGRA